MAKKKVAPKGKAKGTFPGVQGQIPPKKGKASAMNAMKAMAMNKMGIGGKPC